jgi:hypothetical protein
MNECILPVGVSALACAVAGDIENTDDLFLLAAVLGQLSSALTTIASQRIKSQGSVVKLNDYN